MERNGSFGFLSVGSCDGKNQMCHLCGGLFTLSDNVLQLKEVGDFSHKCSYEAQMFVQPQNCHTKHRAANFF